MTNINVGNSIARTCKGGSVGVKIPRHAGLHAGLQRTATEQCNKCLDCSLASRDYCLFINPGKGKARAHAKETRNI